MAKMNTISQDPSTSVIREPSKQLSDQYQLTINIFNCVAQFYSLTIRVFTGQLKPFQPKIKLRVQMQLGTRLTIQTLLAILGRPTVYTPPGRLKIQTPVKMDRGLEKGDKTTFLKCHHYVSQKHQENLMNQSLSSHGIQKATLILLTESYQ